MSREQRKVQAQSSRCQSNLTSTKACETGQECLGRSAASCKGFGSLVRYHCSQPYLHYGQDDRPKYFKAVPAPSFYIHSRHIRGARVSGKAAPLEAIGKAI